MQRASTEPRPCWPAGKACHHQDAIHPGEPWLDTKGERIQAHGGAVYYEDGVYYLHAEREAARSYADLRPPFTREAPALFEKDGRKNMMTSGMTGYVPNRSDSAVSDTWDDVFESIADYVWLPISWENGKPCIRWRDEWKIGKE